MGASFLPGRLAAALALGLALLGGAAPAAARSVTDSAGRTVTVPDSVGRVFAAGPPAAVILYTLAPDLLVGWPRALPDAAAPFVAERYRALPETGRLAGRGDSANLEVVLRHRPDLIVDYGSLAPTFVSLGERVQEQLGIPFVLIDGRFEAIPEAYRTLGRLLGREERAGRLAAAAEAILAERDSLLAAVPPAERPRVYYGRGPDGLQTGLAGSINVELIERAGAVNVAAGAGRGSLADVSMEQVLGWDPDVVVTIDPTFFRGVRDDPRWQGIRAVRAGRIHLAPALPFSWIDFPPSVNRLMGVRWLAHALYPDRAAGDLRAQARDFYALFYGHDLGDADLDGLLGAARP
ncbi:ABC transporter substrate-binding protein [Azospirillum sp. ST 5-10]|uniref:ABC transporter substrate-binding protein n=1 Tax=unclassified Azospirillum TaxID=2630922 RepID=UPI003F49D211